jgi:two-component system, LytTR family, sensor kinase
MKTKYKILVHFIYWVYIINQSLSTILISNAVKEVHYYYTDVFWSTFLNIISFYGVYFSINYVFKRNRIVLSIILCFLLIAGSTLIRFPIDYIFWKYIYVLPEKDTVFQWAWVWNELRMVIITGIYAVLIHFTIRLFETQKLKAELINQKQAGELALLRFQINPHFLFNTLNNIYSLVYKKSDDAPEAVMKLSSIMRYTLYDANTEKVPLEKEIDFLKSFIELQNLRIKASNFVDFRVSGPVETVTVAPMLFISFVENAFKHGMKKVQSPGILINLVVAEKRIIFEVVNYDKTNDPPNKDNVGGIGLQNIKRRLELLYGNKHKLDICRENEKFIVKLEIEIS